MGDDRPATIRPPATAASIAGLVRLRLRLRLRRRQRPPDIRESWQVVLIGPDGPPTRPPDEGICLGDRPGASRQLCS